MAIAHLGCLPTRDKPPARVFTDGLEHPKPRLSRRGIGSSPHEAAFNQPQHQPAQVHARRKDVCTDRLGRVECPSARKHRKTGEQGLLPWCQQVAAPTDGCLQRSLAGRQISQLRSVRLLQPSQQRIGPEHRGARRGELDREWHAVQPAANRDERVPIRRGQLEVRDDRLCTIHEQLDRGRVRDRFQRVRPIGARNRQWLDHEAPLRSQAKRGPARHQDAQPRTLR